jgi:hypothetical protein
LPVPRTEPRCGFAATSRQGRYTGQGSDRKISLSQLSTINYILKLVFLFLEQHVERGQRALAACDVLLSFQLKPLSVPAVDSYDAKRYTPS